MEEDPLHKCSPSPHTSLPPFSALGRNNSTLHVYIFHRRLRLVELTDIQLGYNEPCIGPLVIQMKIQDGRRSYNICLDSPRYQSYPPSPPLMCLEQGRPIHMIIWGP